MGLYFDREPGVEVQVGVSEAGGQALRREMAKSVKLAVVGDLMLGRGISRRLHDHPPN